MLCIDPYYTALPGSPVSYAYYGRHPVLRIPIILLAGTYTQAKRKSA